MLKRRFELKAVAALACLALLIAHPAGQSPSQNAARTILAIGAHAGDMEVTCGAVLALQKKKGDRVVLLHLTLGEGGNPKLSPQAYGEQKRREALSAAKALGAEAIFGPYQDGQLPNTEEARRYVADVIRQVKPTHVITHWEKSIHKDHASAHAIVKDAVLLASLAGVVTEHPPHRVGALYYAENWEDAEGFKPYLYVDVSEVLAQWKECVTQYEFIRGGVSSFPYLDYYEALARLRGAEARKRYAVAFDVDPLAKKRVLDSLP
ncbi:MAG TPA: PIG-L family deacetylase [Blastocatellia bacterium]|nr:PIG-L family deacetylase [Blastocatellia bacterium]